MSRIADEVGYKVSEIQRMVEYLTLDGFLIKTASGGYAPGARAYGLADRKMDSAVIARAEGPMRRYSSRSGESVHLGRLVDEKLHVITSYSIHYTKLYEYTDAHGRRMGTRGG